MYRQRLSHLFGFFKLRIPSLTDGPGLGDLRLKTVVVKSSVLAFLDPRSFKNFLDGVPDRDGSSLTIDDANDDDNTPLAYKKVMMNLIFSSVFF